MARPKHYLIAADNPLLQQYQPLFEHFKKPDMHTLVLSVDPDVVDDLYVNLLVELIAAAEYDEVVLEKLLFSIHFDFKQVADSELYYQETEWKSSTKHYQWFYQINQVISFAFFFLQDYDSRFYCIAGDFLAEGNIEIKHDEGSKRPLISFDTEQAEQIMLRVFWGCVYFMHYCFGTRVDPQPAIEAIIAEYNMEFTFDHVRKEYRKQRAKGYVFRLGTSD